MFRALLSVGAAGVSLPGVRGSFPSFFENYVFCAPSLTPLGANGVDFPWTVRRLGPLAVRRLVVYDHLFFLRMSVPRVHSLPLSPRRARGGLSLGQEAEGVIGCLSSSFPWEPLGSLSQGSGAHFPPFLRNLFLVLPPSLPSARAGLISLGQ